MPAPSQQSYQLLDPRVAPFYHLAPPQTRSSTSMATTTAAAPRAAPLHSSKSSWNDRTLNLDPLYSYNGLKDASLQSYFAPRKEFLINAGLITTKGQVIVQKHRGLGKVRLAEKIFLAVDKHREIVEEEVRLQAHTHNARRTEMKSELEEEGSKLRARMRQKLFAAKSRSERAAK